MAVLKSRKLKKRKFAYLAHLFDVDEKTKALLRGLDDDKVPDHEDSEEYEADDEEYEDKEEETSIEVSAEI